MFSHELSMFHKLNKLPKTWATRSKFGAKSSNWYPITLPFTDFKYTAAQLAAWQSLPYNLSPLAITEKHKSDTSTCYDGDRVTLAEKLPQHQKKKTLAIALRNALTRVDEDGGNTRYRIQCYMGEIAIGVRPGVHNFLRQMNDLFELVFIDEHWPRIGAELLVLLDPNAELFDDHLLEDNDLFATGRPLDDIVFVGTTERQFEYQPRNSIHVPEYGLDRDDSCLIDIIPMMKEIAKADRVYDVLDPFNAQFVHPRDLLPSPNYNDEREMSERFWRVQEEISKCVDDSDLSRNTYFPRPTKPRFTNFKYTPAQLAAWQSFPYNLSRHAITDEQKLNTSKGYSSERLMLPSKLDEHKSKITAIVTLQQVLLNKPERLGARDFLLQMNELFELFVFDRDGPERGRVIMRQLDPDNKLGDHFHNHRILNNRHCTAFSNRNAIDLFATGRPLDRIFLIVSDSPPSTRVRYLF
jgi:TFIIF-interacting CTD phosphatase-like protein